MIVKIEEFKAEGKIYQEAEYEDKVNKIADTFLSKIEEIRNLSNKIVDEVAAAKFGVFLGRFSAKFFPNILSFGTRIAFQLNYFIKNFFDSPQ